MERSKRNNVKHVAQHSSVRPSKYQPDGNLRENGWTCQKDFLTASAVRNIRRIPNPTIHSSSFLTTCTQHKHPSCPNFERQKYSAVQNLPGRHCISPSTQSRLVRTKLCSNNPAVIRKSRYQDEPEDNDNLEYVGEEHGNCTEDSADDDLCGEAEEDQKGTVDSIDNHYELQEADDKVDEESDSFFLPESQAQKAISRFSQKLRSKSRQFHYQPPSQQRKAYQQNLSARYYHDPDIPVSEEELPRSAPAKSTSKKSAMGDLRTWTQGRCSFDRDEPSNLLMRPARRARPRSEKESLLEVESADTKRCSRCGSSSDKKEFPMRKNNCRFQAEYNSPVRGAIGDKVNVGEQLHNRCNRRGPDNMDATREIPRSVYCAIKPRRSRGSNVPVYEAAEDQNEQQLINEITNDYRLSRYPREMLNVLRDKTRHPAQTARGQNSKLPSKYAT